MMDGGGEDLDPGGFGLGEFGFQGVAQGQQLGDLADDPLLLREGRNSVHRRRLENAPLNCTLAVRNSLPHKRKKPLDFLVERLNLKKSRGDTI
jgi:hypothetical protein